jgi:hypothetical protein
MAISTSHSNTLYKDVILACALALKDSIGRFTLKDIQAPLQKITGKYYASAAYQVHLSRFCEPGHGSVLKKTGERRHYRWKFVNPHLVAYVILAGTNDGRLTEYWEE